LQKNCYVCRAKTAHSKEWTKKADMREYRKTLNENYGKLPDKCLQPMIFCEDCYQIVFRHSKPTMRFLSGMVRLKHFKIVKDEKQIIFAPDPNDGCNKCEYKNCPVNSIAN
jgi:hypothetical protein